MKHALLAAAIFFAADLYGQVDLNKPFEDCNIKGSTTIYDYNERKWISSDINDSHFATLPASTFKIIHTLIALETGIIKDENEIIKWPGETDTIKYGYRPEIYRDITIKEAFKVSAGWAYVEVAKKIDRDLYSLHLAGSRYGNEDISIDDPDFWNFGDLAISPANQIGILIGVYEETLPFEKRSFKILKDLMLEEHNDDYKIWAKTGWTRDKGKDIGWWVGYVESNGNVYFFATRIHKDRGLHNPGFAMCRKDITLDILRQIKAIK